MVSTDNNQYLWLHTEERRIQLKVVGNTCFFSLAVYLSFLPSLAEGAVSK